MTRKNPETYSQRDFNYAIERSGAVVYSTWVNPLERKQPTAARMVIDLASEDKRYEFIDLAHDEVQPLTYAIGPRPSRDPSSTRAGYKADIRLNYLEHNGEVTAIHDNRGNREDNQHELEVFISRNLLHFADTNEKHAA